jgi:hypothetical protein
VACACESSAPASSLEGPPAALASDWTGAREASSPPSPPSPPVAADSDGSAPAAPFDGAGGTWVLHVGDSFVGGPFAQSLAPRFEAVGARPVAIAKTSTFTTTWAVDPELDGWLARRPALVLVTLGANEVETPTPELRAGAVHALARKVGAVAPCVWIAPPLWVDDSHGLLQVLHDHCDPCLFFDSDAFLRRLGNDERWSDHIHPNGRGGARWAQAFWGWLEDHRDRTRRAWSLVPFETR